VLNFKKLPYKTVWVEYPDIEPEMKKIGAKPTSTRLDGTPRYTVPVIHDPNTSVVLSDSYGIAEYLERAYPDSPKVFPPGTEGLQAAFSVAFKIVLQKGVPDLIRKVVFNKLNPASQEYFRTTREKSFGKTIESLDEDAEKQWEEARAAWTKAAGWYEKNGTGIFIHGDRLSYGDFITAAWFGWYGNMTDRESEEWKIMLSWDGGRWARLMEAVKPYETLDWETKS